MFAKHIFEEEQCAEKAGRGLLNITKWLPQQFKKETDFDYVIGKRKRKQEKPDEPKAEEDAEEEAEENVEEDAEDNEYINSTYKMSQKHETLDCVGEAYMSHKPVNFLLSIFTLAVGGVFLIKFICFFF
jgi:hypothetical protein